MTTTDSQVVVHIHNHGNEEISLVLDKLGILMTKIEEMNVALDELAALVTEGLAEIEAQMAIVVNPGTSDADMDAARARLIDATANLRAGVERLKSDNPPVPVPVA